MKDLYARPGDEFEVAVNEFVVDIKRPGRLIEIQTGAFGAMGRKFDRLLAGHRILLVHPIAVETYLERPGKKTRKSPKRGSIYSVFEELVSIPTLIDHPNLEIDLVLVSITKVQRPAPRARRGLGGYRTLDRKLRHVVDTRSFRSAGDLAALLPDDLPDEFTTADIASAAGVSRDTAQRMAFCYRALEVIHRVRRTRAGIHYARA